MHRRRDLLRRICLAVALMGARAARAQMPDLIATLSARLGITDEQAARGAGAVFRLAERRLSPAEFSEGPMIWRCRSRCSACPRP